MTRAVTGQGGPADQTAVGDAYRDGEGFPAKKDAAIRGCPAAAQRDAREGERNLGLMYMQGGAVAQGAAEGIRWLKRAAEPQLSLCQQ